MRQHKFHFVYNYQQGYLHILSMYAQNILPLNKKLNTKKKYLFWKAEDNSDIRHLHQSLLQGCNWVN